MTMSQMNLNTDKDQSQLGQLECDTYTNLDPTKVEQSQQKQGQNLAKRTNQQLSEAERIITVEIDKCFENWHEPWKRTYLDNGPEFSAIYDLMEGLIHYQDQILCSETVLPIDRSNSIAKAVARLIDYGNAILDIDITIRANDGSFREVDPSRMTTIELYQAHIGAHKLRDKLLQNYFKTARSKHSGDSESSQQQLRVPTMTFSNLPSPTMERSQRFSAGSNTSINTIVTNGSTGGDGRRTPQTLNSSLIEVKTMSSTEDLTESQLEMRHIIATLKSGAFMNPEPSPIRLTLLQAALSKIENLSPRTNTERLTDCFELLDTLLNSIERVPRESRKAEVQMIASSLLQTLVFKAQVDDHEHGLEFQHAHWATYLISLIRMMSDSDFKTYLGKFSKSKELSAFLSDYLSAVKRLTSRPDELTQHGKPIVPIYPNCWIEITLLVCTSLLKSLIYLYQILRSTYPSNLPILHSYIDCLIRFSLQDVLRPDRIMPKQRQVLLADDLRKTTTDYIWITWDSLSTSQKNEISSDIIGPLLSVSIALRSRQRSILLPIFYDMMHCDFTSQYMSPRSTSCGSESICSQTTIDQIGNRANYIYELENQLQLEQQQQQLPASRKSTSNSNESGDTNRSLSATNQELLMHRYNSDESLPYLGFQYQPQVTNQQSPNRSRTSTFEDAIAMSKFTHLLVGKLHDLMVELELGDEQFKMELCSTLSGESRTVSHQQAQNQAVAMATSEASQFKHLAKQTASVVSDFIQISLDLRLASKLSYNHLHLLCLFKLIQFFRDKVDRIELYITYLQKLWLIHHRAGRLIEAGFTLLDVAKASTWSNEPLESHYRALTRQFHLSRPPSNHIEFKMFLYTTIIEYFDKSQLWEAAVPLCRELMDVYQLKLFDYSRLAEILAKLSTLFANICGSNQRSHPEYFRVTFYGNGFPDCLRNTTMVYRGKAYERLGDFQATLLSKYPDAKLLRTLEQPEESLLNEPEAKYLQINACTPISNIKSKFANATTATSTAATFPPQPPPASQLANAAIVDINELPEFISTYYKHNECDKFEFSRRLGGNSGGDDFANMWRQRVTLTTNTLPGMLPFSCVILQETNIISPIECAIEDLERANDRLSSMVNRFRADKRQEEDARALGQLLLGIVDAAVNGGITKYEQAFFGRSDGGTTNTRSLAQRSCGQTVEQNSILPSAAATTTSAYPDDSARGPLSPSSALQLGGAEQNTGIERPMSTSGLHLTPHVAGADKCQRVQNYDHNVVTTAAAGNASNGLITAPRTDQIERMKRLIAGQVPLLDEAIRLHAERVADVMRPQHEHLEASYKRLKHHIMSKYSRYLPAHYNRNSSFSLASGSGSTLRSHRSLARSPNRSTRSESRISAAFQTSSTSTPNGSSDRYNSKRMSDVGRGADGHSVTIKLNDLDGVFTSGDAGQRHHSTNSNSSSIPYQQLYNERRSLPFLAGASSIKLNDPASVAGPPALPAQHSPRASAVMSKQSTPSSPGRSTFHTDVPPPPPPAPPPRASQCAMAKDMYSSTHMSLTEISLTAPPPPPPRLKTSTPSQFNEAPHARLLQSDEDDDDDDDGAVRGEEIKPEDRRQQPDDELLTL